MSLNNIYKNPILLQKSQHASLKISRKQSYAFASAMNSVPVTGTEFFQASRNYPIFFVKAGEERLIPIAIVSFKQNAHDLGDTWQGVYVPAFLRRYPFVLSGDHNVLIDESAPHFSETEGEALFGEDGEPSDFLIEIVKFLEFVDTSFQLTEAFTKAMVELDLLKPFDSTVKFGDSSVRLNDLLCLDEAKLHQTLDEEQAYEWFQKGWLAWSHAHLHSLGSIGEVVKRHQAEAVPLGQ